MRIKELIKELEIAKERHGNVECLIEIEIEHTYALVPVEELNFEDRPGFGASVSLLN